MTPALRFAELPFRKAPGFAFGVCSRSEDTANALNALNLAAAQGWHLTSKATLAEGEDQEQKGYGKGYSVADAVSMIAVSMIEAVSSLEAGKAVEAAR